MCSPKLLNFLKGSGISVKGLCKLFFKKSLFGIFSGISCGAVVRAAAMLAERIDSGNIVLILADGGWKYLSTQLWTKDYSEIKENVKDVLWW
mgnify:CR=1 FL=1